MLGLKGQSMTEMSKTPEISDAVLAELPKGYERPEDLLGPDGLMKALKKRLIEKALGAELTAHLGYEKSDPAGHGSGNNRNGASKKTVKSEDGAVEVEIPPRPQRQLVANHLTTDTRHRGNQHGGQGILFYSPIAGGANSANVIG
jgi:hypothetical protein